MSTTRKSLECCVFGYAKENESQFSINIPLSIKKLFLFYYLLKEKFTTHGPKIHLEAKKTIAKFTGPKGLINKVYGNVVVNTNDTSITHYKWVLKINYEDAMDAMGMKIGIDSNDKTIITPITCFSMQYIPSPIYAFRALGGYYQHPKCPVYSNKPWWRNDDIITILLNCKNKSLKLYINDKKNETIENIILKNTTYHLAISMGSPSQQVQLLHFETYNNC